MRGCSRREHLFSSIFRWYTKTYHSRRKYPLEARRHALYLRNRRHTKASLDRSPTVQQTSQCDTTTVHELNKVNIMSDQELSTRSNHALWLAIGVMLVPLVPYALSGSGG
jgi:hypothetical protein